MASVESAIQEQPKINFKTLDIGDRESFLKIAKLKQRIWGGESLTADELQTQVSQGIIIGVLYSGNQIIGTASAIVNVKAESPNPTIKKLPKESLYAFGAGIDPAFRGKGLQKVLLEKRIDIARQLSKETVIGSVRPENGASLRSITSIGGRVLAYSPNYYSHSENPARIVWEIDTTLQHEAEELIDKEEVLTPEVVLEKIEKKEKRIVLLVQSGEVVDVEAQKAIAQILSKDYVGTGIQSLYTDDAGVRFNAMIFRHLSSFLPEVEKRLRARKKKIQDIYFSHHPKIE